MLHVAKHLAFLAGAAVLAAAGSPQPTFGATATAYFCPTSHQYYPWVGTCDVPWLTAAPPAVADVPATPPRSPETPAAPPPPAQTPAGPQADDAQRQPASGDSAVFVFGPQQHPIECAPLQICDLVLQAGEHVSTMKIGDTAGWTVEPLTEGTGPSTVEHLLISSKTKNRSTSMVVATDRRIYHLRLDSFSDGYMAQISFSYPDDRPSDAATAPPPAADPKPPVSKTGAPPPRKRPPSQRDAAADDGFTTVGGTKYIKGREPRPLGGDDGQTEPPPPQAAPRPNITQSGLQ